MEASEGASESSSQAFDYDRTVALSDGVFAIALTLLVLTISFPDLHGAARGRLGHELANRGSELFSYALSFAVLSLLWLRHHAFFRALARIDGRVAGLNLIYLALIAFLPYPTRLLGQYGEQPVAVVGYAATIVLISTVSILVRLHAARAGLLRAPSADTWRRLALPLAVFLLSIPLALLVSPDAAKYSWLVLAVPGTGLGLARRSRRSTT